MLYILYLIKLLLFSLIFISQNYLTLQININNALLKPLADYWNVPVNDVPELLAIEQKLTNATAVLTPLLYQYNESFGGFYIDVKANLVVINTIDFTKVPEIKFSPYMKDFINLLNFTRANYSTHQLESSLNSLTELIDSTNPVNIIMGISPIYNLIVIDLSHYDDKGNEAFLNDTLPFEQFIFINYEDDPDDNSDNYSLSLRFTSHSSSSKHQTKRDIELWFLGGEGIAIKHNNNDSLANVYCSAGFSAIHPSNFSKYIFTSARCLPNNAREILHAVWDSPVASLVPFGVIKSWSLAHADYALFEKINPDFKSNPFIRNSQFSTAIPYIYIDSFNLNGTKLPVGHEICISGYESHVMCGTVEDNGSRHNLKSIRPGNNVDQFAHMIKASINGPLSEMDRGGTVFTIANGIIVVQGILTSFRYVAYKNTSNVVIQPLFNIISQNIDFQNFIFVDLNIYQQMKPFL